jgi:hypothetical protein
LRRLFAARRVGPQAGIDGVTRTPRARPGP